MSALHPLARVYLRRVIRQSIVDGQLPPEALNLLWDGDSMASLESGVAEMAGGDGATYMLAGGPSPSPAPSPAGKQHPILKWILQNLPAILSLVLQLLSGFGVKVPPITIPPLTPPGSDSVPTAERAPLAAAQAAMPTEMALPPWAITLAEQIAAKVIAQVLPVVENKIQEWVKAHS